MVAGPGIPRFKGSFKTFSVTAFTNRETGTESRLLVYSQGSRTKVNEYLWLKFLWDELTKTEMELFLIMPETLKNPLKVGALRAILEIGKLRVRNKILKFPFKSKKECPSRERYRGYRRLNVEIHWISRSLPRVPKFSGWVRSSSAIGTKRPRGSSLLEPLAIHENDYADNEFNWYSYLTVGES